MKALFFTKYTRQGASSRLRTFQYLDFLEANGVSCTVQPFFNEIYLEEVYRKKRHNKWLAFLSFSNRVRALASVGRYDQVIIEKELFPYFPPWFEWILFKTGIKYIVDYDDAIFHNYDVSPNVLVRFFLGNKIRNVIRYAAIVVVGNEYLKEKAREFGAAKVIEIPTVVDVDKYQVAQNRVSNRFTIGWIGSPITFKYLYFLEPVFKSLSSRYSIRFRYIGANKTLGLPNEEVIPWDEANEVTHIQEFDAGIMPLEDNIWERGKCGYKLIQYLACGVPVVGTPLGVNNVIIRDGYNGFKASTLQQWENALEKLITNSRESNDKMGLNGRQMVEEKYSLQAYRLRWLNIIKTGNS